MSYHGYIPTIKDFIHRCVPFDRSPAVLEVGIDRGTTMIPLVAFLARTRPRFMVVGIDVKVQEQVALMLSNLDLTSEQQAFCVEGNSLDVLPRLVGQGLRFDVVLIDGDHNYHTVSRELTSLDELVTAQSLVICDDYGGRWSERDLWYSERDGYQEVASATRRVETDKKGVKAAVDEWLAGHPAWTSSRPLAGEPIVLMRTNS